MAAPIPREPPVTNARFPASSRCPEPFPSVVMPPFPFDCVPLDGKESLCAKHEFVEIATHPVKPFHGMPGKQWEAKTK